MIFKFALLLKNGCIPFGLVVLIRVVALAATAGKYCIEENKEKVVAKVVDFPDFNI